MNLPHLVTGLLLVVGVINLLPVLGAASGARIAAAYGIGVDGMELEVLLRHRAVLFGVLGGFVIYAAFVPSYQPAAMVMAGVSMLGYAWLVWSVGGVNANLQRVLMVDLVGVFCLVLAAGLRLLGR